MDPSIKITKKSTKKFDSKVINRLYFHRNTRLNTSLTAHSRSLARKKRVAINLAPKVVCFTSIAINHLEWSPLAFGRLTCVHTFMDLSTKIMALGRF